MHELENEPHVGSKYCTIQKLMDEHSKIPGDLKLRHKDWTKEKYFQPFYLSIVTDCWYGLDEVGGSLCLAANHAGFYVDEKAEQCELELLREIYCRAKIYLKNGVPGDQVDLENAVIDMTMFLQGFDK